MNTFFDNVGDFHRKFNIPAFNPFKICRFPSKRILEYRLKFLEEELEEYKKAVAEKNLVDALDALADLAYVALGTAHYYNAPMNEIWAEVQRSNMGRVLATPETCPPDKLYRADLVIKPPGWVGPRIKDILDRQNFRSYRESLR